MAEDHAGQGRLADAGRAAEQDHRPRDDAAPQHAVELSDPGLQPGDPLRGDVAQRHRPPGRCAAARGAPRPAGRRDRHDLLDERVPLAAARALAVPLRRDVGAAGADVSGGGSCHGRRT
jgi:hypothetical protein